MWTSLLPQSMKGAFDYVIRLQLMFHFMHFNRATNQESRTTFNKYVIHRPGERSAFNCQLRILFIIILHKVLFI